MKSDKPTDTTTDLPPLTVENVRAFEANFNMREWVRKALEAKGAKFTGGSYGAEDSDLDVELEGHSYNITIRPSRRYTRP